jgi:hypothetical protein
MKKMIKNGESISKINDAGFVKYTFRFMERRKGKASFASDASFKSEEDDNISRYKFITVPPDDGNIAHNQK